jgi:deazaflavin-dependent oxidoreductase (nitroreductase family)
MEAPSRESRESTTGHEGVQVSEYDDTNASVIKEFRANAGKVGGQFEGLALILIHHVGAKSGTVRVTPLVYVPDGDRLVIIASKGGAPTHPDWYYNVKANPVFDVEVGTEKFSVKATEVVGDERERLWARVVEQMPWFADYQRKTTRQIPLFTLTRES